LKGLTYEDKGNPVLELSFWEYIGRTGVGESDKGEGDGEREEETHRLE